MIVSTPSWAKTRAVTLQQGDVAPFAGELILAEDLAKLLVLVEEGQRREALTVELMRDLLAAGEDQRLDGERALKAEVLSLRSEVEVVRAEHFGWEWLVLAGLSGAISGGLAITLIAH